MDLQQIAKSVEECTNKNKEFIPFSDIFVDCLSTFLSKFSEYKLEPDYENFCSRLSNLKVTYSKDIDKIVLYNQETNSIQINTDKIKEINNPQVLERLFSSSILNMFTYVYNLENDSFNRGITFKQNGEELGTFMNEKMDDRIMELFFGNIEENDSTISLPSAKDQLCMDMESLVGSENLFTYYLNGRGDLFFSKLGGLFDTKEECIDFIKNTEKLREYKQENEDDYYKNIEILAKKAEIKAEESKFGL